MNIVTVPEIPLALTLPAIRIPERARAHTHWVLSICIHKRAPNEAIPSRFAGEATLRFVDWRVS